MREWSTAELLKQIAMLEHEIQRISTLLGGSLGRLSKEDLFSEMAFIVEDIERMRAEMRRRGAPAFLEPVTA
jgi:uncharacterized small protein (DUF1192 family)